MAMNKGKRAKILAMGGVVFLLRMQSQPGAGADPADGDRGGDPGHIPCGAADEPE